MSKKSKNKAKAKQNSAQSTKSAVKQPNNPNVVDIPKSNPENFITIEIPDKPEDIAVKQSAASQNKTAKNGKSSKSDKPKKQKQNQNISASTQKTQPKANTDKKTASAKPKTKSVEKAEPKPSASVKSNTTKKSPKSDKSKVVSEVTDNVKKLAANLKDKLSELSKLLKRKKSSEKPPLTPEQLAARKRRQRSVLTKTADISVITVVTIVGLLLLLPIFFAVVQSFKPISEFRDVPQTFFPKKFSFQSFGELFRSQGDNGISVLRFMFNTAALAVVVTILRLAVTISAAYVLAKVKAPMLKTVNWVINITLALTPALTYTMNYVLLAKVRLVDTPFALILPLIASPLCLVLIRESIRHIPDEIILAARLEGCSHTAIIQKIVYPQIKPASITVSVLTLFEMGKVTGGIAVFSEKLATLPTFMEMLYNRQAVGEMYALAVIMLIPVVILLVVFRKSLLKTMTTALLKKEK